MLHSGLANELSLSRRILRSLLRSINNQVKTPKPDVPEPFDPDLLRRAEAALHDLPPRAADGKRYLEKHIPRLARTLAMVPPPQSTGRVLELGCYVQITPLLERLSG